VKPIQLKLSGMHSYRELQVVDFEKLCEAGLFGIFGPTGSGKSTILDAITLALYGQVVRMGGGSHPKEVLNQLEDRLFVSFTFELGGGDMRRRYTIEREFGVDKKGNKRQPEVRLIERAMSPGQEDRVLESKATAATAAVEQLIGLTIHDFTRAVVLPQGQFSRFLTLTGKERNEMLQRMFYLHEYGEKLSEQVRGAYEQNKAELHQLELALAGLGDAGPDALLAASQELESKAKLEVQAAEDYRALSEKRREWEQIRSWQTERSALLDKLAAMQAEAADVEALAERIAEMEASAQVWPVLERYRHIQLRRQQTEQQLQSLRLQRDEQTLVYRHKEQAYQTLQARLRAEEPLLIEEKSRMEQAAQWEEELLREKAALESVQNELAEVQARGERAAKAVAAAERELQRLDEELNLLDGQLQQLSVSAEERKRINGLLEAKKAWKQAVQRLQEAEREAAEAKKQQSNVAEQAHRGQLAWQKASEERERAQNLLAEAEAALQEMPGEEEMERLRDTLVQIKLIGQEWRELSRAQLAWQQRRLALEESWNGAEEQCRQAEAAFQSAAAEQSKKQQFKQQAEENWLRWRQDNLVQHLREQLTEGEPCPICGSVDHRTAHLPGGSEALAAAPLAGEGEYRLALEVCQAELETAEEALRRTSEAWQAAKLELETLKRDRSKLEEEQLVLQERSEQIRNRLAECGEGWQAGSVDELSRMFKEQEANSRLLGERREQQRLLLQSRQQTLAALREQELEQKSAYDKLTAVREQWDERAAAAEKRCSQAQSEADQAAEYLQQLGSSGELAAEHIEAAAAELDERETRHAKLQQTKLERTEQRKRLHAELEQSRSDHTRLAIQQAGLAERLQERRQLWEQKQRQWLERTGGEQARVRLQQLEQQLSRLREEVHTAEQAYKQAADDRQMLMETLLKAEEAAALLARQQQEAEAELQAAVKASGLQELSRVEAAHREREKLADYKARVEHFRTLRSQLEYDEQRLAKQLNGRSVDEAEWAKLNAACDECEQALQLLKDQVAVARQSLATIESNHQKWLSLQARCTEIRDEQSRLEELRRLFEGKAFVQFIAEEKLASIARDASFHLARMTKNRYGLELGAEGEFVLRDEGAGGLRRPVSTLSGGETFLTSLALALALSVEIQLNGGRLEFFFLDEGFGTLDPELLEVVMDALERLRMADFAIGVISHVPEMRMRMPRRLIVTPAEPIGAGSRIAMEID
jgi:exonuclease SbcC